MAHAAKQLTAALAALVGLALTLVGAWFAIHLGPTGTATFTTPTAGTSRAGAGTLVLGPQVLNRVDRPVEVTARTEAGASVRLAVTAPADARAALGPGSRVVGTGVRVRDWRLTTKQQGSGSASVVGSDLWREQATGTGSARITVQQQDAPETLVVTTAAANGGGPPAVQLSLTVRRAVWFWEAVGVVVVGLLLIGAAAVLGRRAWVR